MSRGVAVIGLGQWGLRLAGKFDGHPDFHVQVVCRRTPFSADDRLDMEWGAVNDVGEAINADGVEAVVVATPAASHFAIARQALMAGRHVFLEKPPTLVAAEMMELERLASERKRVVMVDHPFLFTPAYREIRRIIRSGGLGTLLHIHSTRADFGTIPTDVNISAHLLYHDLYLLQDLCEGEPECVRASATSHVLRGIMDTMTADLAFATGPTATVVANMLFPRKIRQVVIAGTLGILEWDETAREKLCWWRHRYEVTDDRVIHHRAPAAEPVAVPEGDALSTLISQFHHCITGGSVPCSGLAQAGAVMRTVWRLDEAAAL